ncbi:hypothetical protein KEM55_002015, partial [Ascosphaera atra]
MASRIEKTIARQQEKIASGAFYESHQQLRVIANRYLKQSNYDAAADILTGGAKALLQAGEQQGASASGGDLAIMLVKDVYVKAEWECVDDEEGKRRKQRLIDILNEFPAEEPSRKRYITELIGWSSKFGDYELGDPDLHHAAGAIFAKENDPYEAERHLALGNQDSATILGRLEHDWYTHDSDATTAGLYACRAVIPYLLTGNLCSANKALRSFISALTDSGKAIPMQRISGSSADVTVFPTLRLLNFLEFLLLAIQRGPSSQDLFRQLARQYAGAIEEVDGLEPALARVGEVYFAIR